MQICTASHNCIAYECEIIYERITTKCIFLKKYMLTGYYNIIICTSLKMFKFWL